MKSEIYLTIAVVAVASLWFVWDLGIKKLFLDYFRERLFEIRFQLFQTAASGELPFDDEAYSISKRFFCGLFLRFGHRLTFLSFLLSIREQHFTKKDKDYADYAKQIELKVSRTPESVQPKLRKILAETHQAVTVYISISSLLFMIAALVWVFLRAFRLIQDFGKREISHVS